MAVTIGSGLLRRLVAAKAGVPLEMAEKLLDAESEVIMAQLRIGAKVRILNGAGFLVVHTTKETRRRIPHTGRIRKIPARERIVFRESSTTKK